MADGSPLQQGLLTGAFAERVVVDRTQLAPITGEIDMAAACLLSCGVITGVGAATIIAVDISEQKLADAREFGATHGVNANQDKPHREIRRICGGRGVDYALVTVGSAEACEKALRYLCQGGELVIVGLPASGSFSSFEPVILASLSQSIAGSNMGDTLLRRDIPWLLELYRQGRLKLDELVSGRYRLEDINLAIQGTASGSVRRNVIVF